MIELAYRLAVSDEPYIKQIRDNVIVSITGATDVDGRDRYVDWYYAYKIDEPYDGGENYGGPPYWGKYVFHDNNRDINYGVDSLRVHLNWYLNWVPPIWHDLHEAQTLLYTFSGQPPQNANLDPILYTELPFFATYEVNKLTSYGMPGVWHFGFVDMWSPGYLGFAAANHNGMLRMYEIFNQGGANTKKARLSGAQTHAAVVPAESGARRRGRLVDPEFDQLRGDRRADRARADVEVPDDGGRELLQEVGERGEARRRQAAARVRDSRRASAIRSQVDRVANLLRRQAIEVHRATAEIKVKEGTFPAGSYIVKLNQPYGPLAKTLLEKQTYPDPALTTYDDSAWSMGMANNIDVKTIEDKTILDARGDAADGGRDHARPPQRSERATGASGSVYIVKHNGALNLITLRYRLKDIADQGARRRRSRSAIIEFPAGSLLIPSSRSSAPQEIESLGLRPRAVAVGALGCPDRRRRSAAHRDVHDLGEHREGRLGPARVRSLGDSVRPDPQGSRAGGREPAIEVRRHRDAAPDATNGKSIVYEQPKLSKPLPYKKNDKFKSLGMYAETDDVRGGMGLAGAAEFQKFVEDGGVLLTLGVASFFPAEFGIAKGVDAQSAGTGLLRAGAVREQRDPDPDASDDVRLRAEDAAGSLCGRSAAAGRTAGRAPSSSPARRPSVRR